MVEYVPGIAGVDEAGRGPLAGPVVAAAVILPDSFDFRGLNDSKKLTPSQRAQLELRIKTEAVWAVAECSQEEIDKLNILWASMLAMERAVACLAVSPPVVMVDGNRIPRNLQMPAQAVVKGDGKIAAIAAASILAKTHRDRLMVEMAHIYPQYGFEKHFGYPTPEHLEALREHGPCPIHRRSFSPVSSYAVVQPLPNEQLCLTFDE